LQGKRFAANDSLSNRKLLWHGTGVAVVAAILKSGLRIMPHSGGRVGRGIYFASENSKSAGYGMLTLFCVLLCNMTGALFHRDCSKCDNVLVAKHFSVYASKRQR